MRAIAQRIEYTPTAIYHHFRNKEALLTELCAADFRALASAFQRIGADRGSDRAPSAERAGLRGVRPGAPDAVPADVHDAASGGGHRRASQRRSGRERVRLPAGDLRRRIASGRLRPEYQDPDELAQMAWAALHGLLALHIVKQDDECIQWRDPSTTATRICDALSRACCATGALIFLRSNLTV